jgi:hypothetical protein
MQVRPNIFYLWLVAAVLLLWSLKFVLTWDAALLCCQLVILEARKIAQTCAA